MRLQGVRRRANVQGVLAIYLSNYPKTCRSLPGYTAGHIGRQDWRWAGRNTSLAFPQQKPTILGLWLLYSARHSPEDDDENDDSAGRMSFLEHLEDLRKRIIHSCVALGVGMVVAFAFMRDLAAFVLAPTLHVLPPGVDLVAGRPTGTFAVWILRADFSGAGHHVPSVALHRASPVCE